MFTHQEAVYRGPFETRTGEPSITNFENVLFIPRKTDCNARDDAWWGLYASDGHLIKEASYRRGYSQQLVGQTPYRTFEDVEFERASPEKYLYGGHMTTHFGHFLIGSFARLWIGLKVDLADYKIVCHSSESLDIWFAQPFIRDLFEALGLQPDNFVHFASATSIPHIIVPETSFEEEHFGYAVYRAWGHQVGMILLRENTKTTIQTPIFLTKTKLRHAIHAAINEDEVVHTLTKEGVKIVHPEDLSIAEQATLWRDCTYILGSAGSALHSSILWPSGAKIGACSVRPKVHTNCGIVDKLNNNNISYTFPLVKRLGSYATKSFIIDDCLQFISPVGVAHQLLRAVGL